VPGGFEYHPAARAELIAEFDWYADRSLAAAEGFIDQVGVAVDQAVSFAMSGQRYLAGTRRIVVRDFPYVVVYRERTGVIEVLAVAHTSRGRVTGAAGCSAPTEHGSGGLAVRGKLLP
jgi:plasmid stabilization system protein ParE